MFNLIQYFNKSNGLYLFAKSFSRIFLFVGVVLKAYSEYDCLNKNLKDFTDKEVITLKNFIAIKFFFRGFINDILFYCLYWVYFYRS